MYLQIQNYFEQRFFEIDPAVLEETIRQNLKVFILLNISLVLCYQLPCERGINFYF